MTHKTLQQILDNPKPEEKKAAELMMDNYKKHGYVASRTMAVDYVQDKLKSTTPEAAKYPFAEKAPSKSFWKKVLKLLQEKF